MTSMLPAASEHVGRWGRRSESPQARYAHGNMFPFSLERVARKPAESTPRRLLNSGETCTPRLPRGYGMAGTIYHGTIGGAFPVGDPLAGGAAVWTTTGKRRPPRTAGEVMCPAETTRWSFPHSAITSASTMRATASRAERHILRAPTAYSVWMDRQPPSAEEMVRTFQKEWARCDAAALAQEQQQGVCSS